MGISGSPVPFSGAERWRELLVSLLVECSRISNLYERPM
jgi:hypothetical protein